MGFAEAPSVAFMRLCSSYSLKYLCVLAEPPRADTPGVKSLRKFSLANDLCFEVAPGSAWMLRKSMRSLIMPLVAPRLLESCLSRHKAFSTSPASSVSTTSFCAS